MGHKITAKISIALIFLITAAALTMPLGDAVTWSDEMRLTTDEEFDGLPSIAQASDGRIWVVWQSRRTGNPDIFYKIYDWTSWTEATQFTSDSSQDISPSILQASYGKLWVFWCSNKEGSFDLFYDTSSDGGGSWLGETRLTTGSDDDHVPSAMEASNGTIFVVWQRDLPGNKELFYRTYNGYEWSPETRLTTDPYHDKLPSIIQTSDGTIWVAWCSNRTGDYELFYKTYDGVLWSEDTRLTTSLNSDTDPSIAQAVDGTIWVVWSSREPKATAYDELYYKTCDNGTTWSESILLSSGSSYENTWPSIAQMNDWKMWVVWTSDRSSNFDIYYKTSSVIVVHDLDVTGIITSSTLAYQGNTIKIYVYVKNDGTVSETFNVTAYYNSTTIENQTVTNLGPKDSTMLTFFWDTTSVSPGNYVISATVEPISGETDLTDNSRTDGNIRIKIPGDVDGDGDVDIVDLAWIARALGTDETMLPWGTGWDEYNPDADMDGDGDVDLFDLFKAGRNYGMHE